MERIFRALADGARRRMLDLLRERDGRTLRELCRGFRMTRFGVMKHLRILARARLVVVVRDGRFARHYLNAVPIQEIADRWLSRYARRIAPALTALKNRIEKERRHGRTPAARLRDGHRHHARAPVAGHHAARARAEVLL